MARSTGRNASHTDRREPGFRIHGAPSGDPVEAFARSVARGMTRRPRRLEAKWLYDARGSQLFEEIARMPEYPLYRAEDAILARCAPDLAQRLGPVTLVELGAGDSTKTRRLLDAFVPQGTRHHVSVDVSASALQSGCAALARRYPDLRIDALVATYEQALQQLPGNEPLLLLFLGSTLGNFEPEEAERFFDAVAGALTPGDHLLLGLDRVKPAERLLRAYNDPHGLTEAFILNVFARMNRELGSGIPLDALRLVTRWEAEAEQVAMYARFERACTLRVAPLDRAWHLERGEEVRVEISRKFRPERVAAQAARHGLALRRVYEDADGDFAVVLLRRA